MNTFLITAFLLMGTATTTVESTGLMNSVRQFMKPKTQQRTYDAVYNVGFTFMPRLKLGKPKTNENVAVVEELAGDTFMCKQQGVLKVSLSNTSLDTSRGRVLIDMLFTKPTGYVFNIGDSETNDGSGDDDGTQSNDAEIVGEDRDFKVYLKDEFSSFNHDNTLISVAAMYTYRMTVILGDGELVWLSDGSNEFNYYKNDGLFALGDQFDIDGSENFDVYIGINRVIKAGTVKTGTGLCSVGVKFLPVLD